MKQTIEYYYSLKIDELFLENDAYHFILDGDDYYFVHYPRDLKELDDIIRCSLELQNKKINCHEIVINNGRSPITKIDELNYVLLRVKDKDDTYNIIDIINMQKSCKLLDAKRALYRNNWAFLWSQKVDYIESQLEQITIDKIVHNSVDYYIGLAESAIYYVNMTNKKDSLSVRDNITLAHRRIYYPNYKLNFLNPLSFIFDLDVRDVASYIKSVFFGGGDAFLELETYLKSVKLSAYSYNMLMARLLYPSYYFDIYEKVVNKHESSEKLIPIISKEQEYFNFLKKAYLMISKYAPLEKIDYLIY